MKRKFLPFAIFMSMLFSFLSFYVNAQEDLTLTNYNVMSNAITLEFSGDVSGVAASVSCGDKTISAASSQVGENSRLWNLKLSEKTDITKKYVLNFTAVPKDTEAYSVMTAKKGIKFDVLWNDDFSSYGTIDDVKTKYKYMTNGAAERSDSAVLWSNTQLVTPNDAQPKYGLVSAAGATITPNGFRYGTSYGKYYTMEAEMSGFTENVRNADIWISRYDFDNDYHAIELYKNNLEFKTQPFSDVTLGKAEYTTSEENTLTVSTFAGTKAADSIQIAMNGDTCVYAEGTYSGEEADKRYVGIRKMYGNYTLCGLKIYRAEMTDVSDFAVKNYEITSKFIKVNLTASPENYSAPHVVSLGENIPVTAAVSDSTIVVKPVSGAFELDREILFTIDEITDAAGQTVTAERKFRLKKLLSEDFENYTSAEQLTKYNVAFGDGGPDSIPVSEAAASDDYKNLFAIDTQSNGNHRLKLNSKTAGGKEAYFTFYRDYPERNNWKDYILEIDIDTDIQDTNNNRQYKMEIIQCASGYSKKGGYIWNAGCQNVINVDAGHTKDIEWSASGFMNFGTADGAWQWGGKGGTPPKASSLIIGRQNDKMIAYLNNNIWYEKTYTLTPAAGEFAVASLCTTEGAQYIDNIKAYKVEELTGSNIYIKTVYKSDTSVLGNLYVKNYDSTVTDATNAIAAVYDGEYKLIGAAVLDVSAAQAAGGDIPFVVTVPETTETVIVKALWWSGLDEMLPIAADTQSVTLN